MMETLNDMLQWLDRIQGLSAAVLVFFSCIVVGYCLRFIKRFPNNGIPLAVVLWGALMMLIIADPRANTMPARVWTMRNLGAGLIIGFLAWLMHRTLIKRLEEFICRKLNLGDTQFFNKEDKTPPPEA